MNDINAAAPVSNPKPERLVSLDAYRGFIMLVMASHGFGFGKVADRFKDSRFWQALDYQFSHVEWVGCSFWDLIQPSFMFMVGVALPYSFASRQARGDSYLRMFLHAVYRSLILVLLAVFLYSVGRPQTNFVFINVLGQIGLGYWFLFLLANRGWRLQLLTAVIILAGYGYLFYQHPLPSPGFDYRTVGVPADWPHLTGWFAHWDKNTNFAADFDRWFLNLFPRPKAFEYEGGGYQTLNFVPSLATMIFGLMAGELLRSQRSQREKFFRLLIAGGACLLFGWALGQWVCPLVKRIWTPSWAVFSTGWTLWMLAGFYGVIDIWRFRRWAFPLVVVGMNSIFIYCMDSLFAGWIRQNLSTHGGSKLFEGTYGPIYASVAVLFVMWLLCFWLYRRKIFLRI